MWWDVASPPVSPVFPFSVLLPAKGPRGLFQSQMSGRVVFPHAYPRLYMDVEVNDSVHGPGPSPVE